MGLMLLCFGVYFIVEAYSLSSWPKLQASVVNTKIKARIEDAGDALRRSLSYYPSITYRYEVNGTSYESSRYRLGSEYNYFQDRADARKVADQFLAGSSLEIFYKPSDPSEAVIDNSITFAVYIPIILSIVFFGFGWGVCWLQDLNSRQECK